MCGKDDTYISSSLVKRGDPRDTLSLTMLYISWPTNNKTLFIKNLKRFSDSFILGYPNFASIISRSQKHTQRGLPIINVSFGYQIIVWFFANVNDEQHRRISSIWCFKWKDLCCLPSDHLFANIQTRNIFHYWCLI